MALVPRVVGSSEWGLHTHWGPIVPGAPDPPRAVQQGCPHAFGNKDDKAPAVGAPTWPPHRWNTGVDKEGAGKGIPCVYEMNGSQVTLAKPVSAFYSPRRRDFVLSSSFFF